jgi:Actin
MRCDPVEHPLLCAEAPFLSKDAREKMVEHLFESFSCPAVFLAKNPVLSSFALGRQTSLVVDIGHTGTVGALLPLSCCLHQAKLLHMLACLVPACVHNLQTLLCTFGTVQKRAGTGECSLHFHSV